MSIKEGGSPRPDVSGAAPEDPRRPDPDPRTGSGKPDTREARLAAALRDNLRRRKAAGRAAKDANMAED